VWLDAIATASSPLVVVSSVITGLGEHPDNANADRFFILGGHVMPAAALDRRSG
jgi:hypothetical protein